MIYDKYQTRAFNRRSLVNDIRELLVIMKFKRPYYKQSIVNEIKRLVKNYISQTDDKEVESFQLEKKDGSYFLDDK